MPKTEPRIQICKMLIQYNLTNNNVHVHKQFSKSNRGFRPLSQHLNYTAAWPLLTESTHCQQTGRKQSTYVNRLSKFTLLTQFTRQDSQTSQATRPTGHNIHAQRKEQNHRNITSFRGTRMQHRKTAVTDSKPPHTHSFHRPHAKAAKITDITPSDNETCYAGNYHQSKKLSTGPISYCPSRQPPLQLNPQIAHSKS